MDEKRLRELAGLDKNLNETLTTRDLTALAEIFGSEGKDSISVKILTRVVKRFISFAKESNPSFNEDRFISFLRKESPRLARALKGEKEPEGSETNEAGLAEGFKDKTGGGKVPMGLFTWVYIPKNRNEAQFIMNSAKVRDVERAVSKGGKVTITADAKDHESLISSFQSLGLDGEVREEE